MMTVGKKRLISILVILLIYMIVLLAVISFRTIAEPEVPPTEPIATVEIEAPHIEEAPSPIAEPVQSIEIPETIENIPAEVEVPEPAEPVLVTTPVDNGELEIVPTTTPESEPEPVQEVVDEPVPTPFPDESTDWTEFEEPIVEEDPWAEFYVAGEEDLSIFEDGTYYVPLLVNDEYLTDINVTFTQEHLLIEVLEFRTIISDLLVDSFEEEFFNTTLEFFSLEYLNEQGIDTWYDYQTFELHMNFPTWMMPTRVLSINRGNIARYSSYSMSGSMPIEPARFSWFTNLSMFSLVDLNEADNWQIDPSSLFTMQAQNSISLFDVAFDFSYTFHPGRAYDQTLSNPWSTSIDDYLTFQGIQGFYDFKPKSLRLTFGNVNDYLGYSTDSIGIALEKRYAYGDATPKTHQFEYEVVVEEPSTVEVFINERSVYRRELQAGIYKLRDFAFTQGANSAKVVISPLANPTMVEELDFLLGYDSRLLAKDDTLYSLSLTFPEYNIGKTTFRVNQQLGLTNTITGSYALALSPTAVTLGLTGLFASPWGSFDTLLGASYSGPLALGLTSKVNYRIAGPEDSSFGSFDFSLGLESRNYNSSLNVDSSTTAASGETWSATTSYSGSIGEFFRYSLGASLSWLSSDSNPNWRLTASTGIPLIPNMSVSGSISLYASTGVSTPQVRGQIGMNYAFTPNLSMSASTDLETSTYASASWRPFGSQNDNMQFSFSSIDFADPLNHQGSISYSHSDTAYGLSVRQQYSDRFTRFSTSLSLNTAFGYAGGLFGMTRSVGDNFLLVKPSGAMKGGDIAVTRTMTSEPSALPSLFGVSMYTGITTHQQNNVVVYGIGDSMLNSSGSYIYNFLPRPRQGYAVRIESEATFSIVGTLLRSPAAAYSRYTTDLYRVVDNDAGEEELVFDETLYLFTDENGFFFLSGVAAGEYQFSLFLPESSDEDPPIDIRFVISPDPKEKDPQVFVLETFVASAISEALEQELFADLMGNEVEERILDENGYYWMEVLEVMDELEFWDTYYPSRQVLDSVTVQDQTGTDSIVEFISPGAAPTTALERMAREKEQQLFNLARLRSIIKPYLDAIDPKPEWKPLDRY